MRDYLRVMVDFHVWQGARLLETAAQVPEQALHDTRIDSGTLFETLWHILDVSYSWRCAAEGMPEERLTHDGAPIETLEALRAEWRTEAERFRALVESWSDADLERTVIPSWRQEPFALCQIAMHIVTHQSDMATSVGWGLTRLGASPGELGFMRYVHTHRDEFGPGS